MKTPDHKSGYNAAAPEDNGYVVADMSGIERQPLLIPRFSGMLSAKKSVPGLDESEKTTVSPPEISAGERKALIGGSVAAGILIIGVMAAVFAGAILLIGHIG